MQSPALGGGGGGGSYRVVSFPMYLRTDILENICLLFVCDMYT